MANKTMHHFYVKDSPDLYEIVDQTARNSINELSSAVAAQGDIVQEMSSDVTDVVNQMADKVDSAYVEDGVAYFCCGDNVLFSITGIGGGGGGGSDTGQTELVFQNLTGWVTKTMSESGTCLLAFNWSSTADGYSTGNGTLTIQVRGVTVISRTVSQGQIEADVTRYLQSGSNRIKATITDSYGNLKSIVFTVALISLVVSSSYDQSQVQSGSFDISYIVTGSGEKNVYFKVDGTQIGTTVITTSGRQSTYTVPAQTHGNHILEIYASSTVDGAELESNHIYLSIISAVSGNTTPIISSSYNADSIAQFDTVVIPYYVYDPTSMTAQIDISINGTTYSEQTVDRTLQTFTYRARSTGQLDITITCGSTSKTFQITVVQSDADIYPETNNLVLYLTAEGRSNNEADPATWSYDNVSAVMTGFNFTSDGWLLDNDNNTVLRVTGDARVTIPYKIFQTDFRSTGKTIEIEFEVHDVRNYDSDIFTCWSNGRGIKLTAQNAMLSSEQTSINTQYKEDEHVRIAFVVEKRTDNRLVYIYINGVMSGVVQYPDDDDFSQPTPVNIQIGSSNCTIDIYNIRVYNNNLTRYQVLTNWIADTQDINEMLDRYERNDVFDDYGNIVIEKLPMDLPYMILTPTGENPHLPQYKGDKTPTSVAFVDESGTFIEFTATGAQNNVQGTSSQYYPRKNYKVSYKGGFMINGELVNVYSLRPGAIATKEFTYKADVASSEGANNVELARLFNMVAPATPGMTNGAPGVRQTIDGFPMVMFHNNGATTTFIGKYNFNNDKGTPEVYGFSLGDESWEIKNNTSDRVRFKSADFVGDAWKEDFEGSYPEDNEDTTKLAAMCSWVTSTDTDATGGDIRLPDNIVFRGGGHPAATGGGDILNTAPETSFWKYLSLYRTPVYKWDLSELQANSGYDETNQYMTSGGRIFYLALVNTNPDFYSNSDLNKNSAISYTGIWRFNARTKQRISYNTAIGAYLQGTDSGMGTTSDNARSNIEFDAAYQDGMYFEIPFYEENADYMYAYWYSSNTMTYPIGVKGGDIIYAGKNTPYYGKKNISDVLVELPSPVTYEGTEYTFDSVQYRVAKFRDELSSHFNLENCLAYYLFTEMFLMVDSRAKNAFPTYWASEGKWYWRLYDADTAIGINNEGSLAFGYELEDTDHTDSGADIFNGQDSTFWNNLRMAFQSEIQSKWQSWRSTGTMSYSTLENMFEVHQSKWPEAIFNEDSFFKYIQPLINDGDGTYLPMAQGSKAEQRKWWLYNRFRYMDSKYSAGDALTDYIQLRGYAKDNITLTPYAHMYAAVRFAQTLVKQRALRGDTYLMRCPLDVVNDTEIYIYDASRLASVGDLSGLKVGLADFSRAIKLQEIKIGDSNVSYSNGNLTNLVLGNNTLLKTLDVRNCNNLTQAVDISGCTNIEEIYFDGTAITGLNLPNGGVLETLHLPNTITNLTVRNQNKITDFVLNSYSQVSTLRIENSAITTLPILLGMADNGRVRLIGVNWSTDTLDEAQEIIDKLDSSRGLDASGNNTELAQVSGEYYADLIDDYQLDILSAYPDLHVTYGEQKAHDWLLYQHLNYQYSDGNYIFSDNNITKIREYAFSERTIFGINCPNVTTVGSYAFQNSTFTKISLPSMTVMNGYYTFNDTTFTGEYYFPSLTTINSPTSTFVRAQTRGIYLPALETTPNASNYMVQNCANLKYFIAPNYSADSNTEGFAKNPLLKYVELGGGRIMRQRQFLEDYVLEHLVLRKTDSPVTCSYALTDSRYNPAGDSPFAGYNGLTAKVYVPRALITSYQTATNWSTFYAGGYTTFLALEDYTVDGTVTGEFKYSLIGLEVYRDES